jgi:hypothetical protein
VNIQSKKVSKSMGHKIRCLNQSQNVKIECELTKLIIISTYQDELWSFPQLSLSKNLAFVILLRLYVLNSLYKPNCNKRYNIINIFLWDTMSCKTFVQLEKALYVSLLLPITQNKTLFFTCVECQFLKNIIFQHPNIQFCLKWDLSRKQRMKSEGNIFATA